MIEPSYQFIRQDRSNKKSRWRFDFMHPQKLIPKLRDDVQHLSNNKLRAYKLESAF